MSVDILPLDLELWTESGHPDNPTELRGRAEAAITSAALDVLVKQQYAPGAVIDWNGSADGANVIASDALLQTIDSLARYGEVANAERLPVPYLPVRLGNLTKSDATLYMGGWSYVAREHQSTGSQVAEGVLIGVLVVATVALVVVALSAIDHGHKGGGHGHAAPSIGDGAVVTTHQVTVSRSRARSDHGSSVGATAARAAFRFTLDMVDAFGHASSDPEFYSHPEYVEDTKLPHEGEQSKMYLEMTLVDNHTGLALWHAHQTFPANGGSTDEVTRAARTLLATLPVN